MKIACIILASGNSVRFGTSKSKLFYKVHGAPIIEYTLKNISKYFSKDSIYITISKKITKNQKNLLSKYSENQLIFGGRTRFESLKKALKNIDYKKYNAVMVHDGARPITPNDLITNLIKSINTKKYNCVVPASIVEDTIRKKMKTLNRKEYMTYQTPQVFDLNFFAERLKKIKFIPTDDFGVVENDSKLKVKIIESSKDNIKITKINDIKILSQLINKKVKFGNGFDIHKLGKGDYLSLAGLKIKSQYQAIGHSDGDVVIHSIIDALLGANNKGDIGKYFPALSKYKNISSKILLNEIHKKIKLNSTIITNIDCTIICQKIRLDNLKRKIEKNISSLLSCNVKNINVKAKTADKVGIIGKSKAIACWTTIKLIKI